MSPLPSIWRVELFHPLVVHFPIALLLAGTVLRLTGASTCTNALEFLVPAGRTLLVIGVLGAWTAIYTGNEAYYEVVRSLCDPTVADAHRSAAYRAAYLFTGAVLLDALLWAERLGPSWNTVLRFVFDALLFLGSGYLGYAGHLGTSLVYQQAAVVHQPSPQCSEFR